MDSNALESLFDRVQKPARYTGGELNSVIKDKERMAIRFAFAFPDLYEVGMSHLGMKILYGLFNAQPDVWCERVFMPDRDMEALLREEEIPLFALEKMCIRDSTGVMALLEKVRRAYPEAAIIWMYGMMNDKLEESLEKGIQDYNACLLYTSRCV